MLLNRMDKLPTVVPAVEVGRRLMIQHENVQNLAKIYDKIINYLPSKHDDGFVAASEERNKPRNRYINILAFDKTRVKLRNVLAHESDYINANYVQVDNCPYRYIATQGPMANTIGHFWQMVWEEKVTVVLMLTNVIENDREKCDIYWPTLNQTLNYGLVSVKFVQQSTCPSYTRREFDIQWNGKDPSSEGRRVIQLQYTGWPDHNVPSSLPDFFQYRSLVRSLQQQNPNNPIIVHCSAGCGRTGTFCTIDSAIYLAEHGLAGDDVVASVVAQLRKQRFGMVQTLGQFGFCYRVVGLFLTQSSLYNQPIKSH